MKFVFTKKYVSVYTIEMRMEEMEERIIHILLIILDAANKKNEFFLFSGIQGATNILIDKI
jgi:hypothetical protein